jgi:DNA-binding response OmpR family regulator
MTTTPRVLVVEDDRSVRELVELILAEDGCEVQARSDSQEALQLLQSWRPDVLLLDLGPPDRDEETVLATYRQQVAEETAVLLLSGSANLDHHATRLGVSGTLAKPFDIDELCATVRHLVAQDHEVSSDCTAFNDR